MSLSGIAARSLNYTRMYVRRLLWQKTRSKVQGTRLSLLQNLLRRLNGSVINKYWSPWTVICMTIPCACLIHSCLNADLSLPPPLSPYHSLSLSIPLSISLSLTKRYKSVTERISNIIQMLSAPDIVIGLGADYAVTNLPLSVCSHAAVFFIYLFHLVIKMLKKKSQRKIVQWI